jgi:PAS domain-containing protein
MGSGVRRLVSANPEIVPMLKNLDQVLPGPKPPSGREAPGLKHESDAKQEYQVILSSIGDAVIVTDHLGTITFANPVAATLTGWELKEALESGGRAAIGFSV